MKFRLILCAGCSVFFVGCAQPSAPQAPYTDSPAPAGKTEKPGSKAKRLAELEASISV